MAYGQEADAKLTGETVKSVLGDVDNQIMRLNKIVGHLTVIGDRLEGSRPQEAAGPTTDHPPHSMINDLQRKRDGLKMLCGQLESAAERIDYALGGGDRQAPSAGRIG